MKYGAFIEKEVVYYNILTSMKVELIHEAYKGTLTSLGSINDAGTKYIQVPEGEAVYYLSVIFHVWIFTHFNSGDIILLLGSD